MLTTSVLSGWSPIILTSIIASGKTNNVVSEQV